MLRLGIRVSGTGAILNKSNPEKSDRLEELRKRILEHLGKLEASEAKQIAKSIRDKGLAKAGVPVGTRHTWKNGIVHVKMPSGKWKRVYDKQDRGAKMAIAAIKKKIAAAPDAQSMMQIILENRDRFSDAQGNPLPFVQELSRYIAEHHQGRIAAKPPEGIPTPASAKESEPESEKKDEDRKKQEDTKDVGPEASNDKKTETPLSSISQQVIERVNIIDDREKLDSWLKSAKDTLRVSRSSSLKEIKRQYEYSGGIEIGDNILYSHDIPDSVSPKDIKDILVYNAQSVVDAIQNRIAVLDDTDTNALNFGRGESKVNEPENRILSDFEKIQDRYNHAQAIEGDEDEIHAGKEIITGKWKLVEADTPTASHDESTFHKTPGFPGNTEESTVNDRDYEHDREAQEVVIEMAGDYDHQAVSIEKPVVVTKDGIVISGNNRTMSSKIAARKGTDKKYIEALIRRAKKFGFTAEQVAQFKHPRVVFETDENSGYSTEQFAKFNDRQEKSMGPISTAVKISKMMKPKTVERIAEKIGEFDTLGELYSNHKACNDIYGILKDAGHVTMQSMPEYMESGYITDNGKSFLENVMLGSVITEKNIRGLNREGCKSIRQKLMRAITPLVENKSMNGYSITKELNEAIDIAMQVSIHKDKFKDVTEYSKQIGMFGDNDPIAIEFAKRLETTQKEFSAFMQSVNGGLRYAANGEADVFLGGTESREDILSRLLQIKKALAEILNGINAL